MSNTIDADLILDTLSDRVITTFGNRMAPVSAFASDFSTDELIQTKDVQVTVVTGGSTGQKNATNFESGDSTTDNVAVTVDHYSQSFHVTSKEVNQRMRLEKLADKNLQTFADDLLDVTFTPVTTTNFGAGITAVQTAIDTDDLKAGWAAVAKGSARHVILDSVAYSQFLPSSKDSLVPGTGAYGFNGFHLNTRWDGAGTNIYGMACSPEAIAIAAGIPVQAPGVAEEMVDQRLVEIPDLGLTVQVNLWVSKASRTLWASYDSMYGASYGKQAGAAEVFKSA